jgi:hypothetical protein
LLSKFESIESKAIPKTDQFLAFTSLEAFQVLCFQKLKGKYLKCLKLRRFWERQPIISAPDRKNTFYGTWLDFILHPGSKTRFNPRKTNFSGSVTSFSIASSIEVISQPVPKQAAFRTGNQ